jgi:hypothetical protein
MQRRNPSTRHGVVDCFLAVGTALAMRVVEECSMQFLSSAKGVNAPGLPGIPRIIRKSPMFKLPRAALPLHSLDPQPTETTLRRKRTTTFAAPNETGRVTTE